MDTLKGNLDLFGLEAIAGLLSTARKTGALRVAVDGLNGRLFFVDGALVYATTRKHDGSVNDLRGRGTEVRDRRRQWSLSLPELLRHQITDVLVRIIRRDGGEFLFDEGVTTTALPSGRTLSFNALEMIHRAEERLEEWRSIEEAIPDSTVKYRLAPDLPPDLFEVTVDSRMWTFLAAVGDGASAGDIAERLRIFEFPAAQKMAELIRRGMLAPVDAEAAAQALRSARASRGAQRAVAEATPPDTPSDDAPQVMVTMVEATPESGVNPVEATSADPTDRIADLYEAETASQALAEWGEDDPSPSQATLETQASTEVVSGADEAIAPADGAAPNHGQHQPEALGPVPAPPAPMPEVPAPPPWIPDGEESG
ncbi:MAG: DUF4388 domain-containing protein [Acidimicrobiia bacterium]|nr:DUF4388 domain-containing protein [Acidimicrobiia bacterium]